MGLFASVYMIEEQESEKSQNDRTLIISQFLAALHDVIHSKTLQLRTLLSEESFAKLKGMEIAKCLSPL